MAPEQITYGKRRNFLKNFGPTGPRRPGADQGISYEPASEISVVRAFAAPNRGSVPAQPRHPDNVEALGAFLGDIGSNPDYLSETKSSDIAQESAMLGSPPVITPRTFDKQPGIMKTEDGTSNNEGPSHAFDYLGDFKTSQNTDQTEMKPMDQQVRRQADAFNASGKSHSHSHDTPSWIDPLRCHPVEYSQELSIQGLDGVSDVKISSTAAAAGRSHNEINTKVTEMLAATEALKPPERCSQPRETIPQSASSRVLAKVSNAWGKLYPKTSKEVSKGPGYSKLALFPSNIGTNAPPTQSTSCYLDDQAVESSPNLSTMEIRLNEGKNLNKKKVQRLIGGQVNRKPLADDGKSLRSGRGISAITASPGLPIAPGTQSHRTKRASLGNQPSNVTPMPVNPFEFEQEFFRDLDTGLLSTPPTGSSTPRTKPAGESSAVADESPLARRHNRTKSDSTSISLKRMSNAETVSVYEKHPYHDLATSSTQCLKRTKALLDLNGPSQPKMKKHPSPNKRDLELLQMALERMSPPLRKSARESQGTDELADHHHQNPRLGPRDPNQSLGTHLVSKSMSDAAFSQSMSAPRQSRLPRPVEKFPSLNNQRRIAPPFRPSYLDADDKDELL